MVKSRYIGDGHPTFNRNPYNWYINPYYWVDDHPLLYGNNGSLDPIAQMIRFHQLRLAWKKGSHFPSKKLPKMGVQNSCFRSRANLTRLIRSTRWVPSQGHNRDLKHDHSAWRIDDHKIFLERCCFSLGNEYLHKPNIFLKGKKRKTSRTNPQESKNCNISPTIISNGYPTLCASLTIVVVTSEKLVVVTFCLSW